MALFEDLVEGKMGTGIALVGAVALAPTLIPVIGRTLRPVAKAAIKGGLVLYRETLAGVGEVTGDLVAEARSELEAEGRTNNGAERQVRRSRSSAAT
jgi:hypothetical protein